MRKIDLVAKLVREAISISDENDPILSSTSVNEERKVTAFG
jgi:hypothetical protein